VHAALQLAVPNLLFPQLRAGRCRAYGSDLRIRVLATGLATYPDVTILCGPREVDPEDANSVTNPTLLVEVLRPSTEDYDRGEKFAHYPRIPSLRQYVLVASDAHRTATLVFDPRIRGGRVTAVSDSRVGHGRRRSVTSMFPEMHRDAKSVFMRT
jgi:hypothetical protein